MDIEDDKGQPKFSHATIKTEQESTEINFAYMVRRLSNIVPNPWQKSRILEENINAMKAKHISDKKIYSNGTFLLDDIEKDIKEQLNDASQKIFTDKLENGDICFKVFKDYINLNWKMATRINFFISKNDKALRKRDESSLQLTLFEKTYEKYHNKLEKDVAWYLDEGETAT